MHVHQHEATSARKMSRLGWTLALISGYMLAELIGGFLTGSLALLADGIHMLSDVAALGLSLFAAWVVKRPITSRQTYGYFRAEILAALANGGMLVAIALLIIIEAFQRLFAPPSVQGGWMMGIAIGGLCVNLIALWLLHSMHSHSLNIKGAQLHVLTDTLGSIGAIIAGFFIWAFQWYWADPAISFVIAFLVIFSSWRLLAESVSVLMEGAPPHVNVDEIREAMLNMEGVLTVHELHVWTITTGMDSLSAHLVTGPLDEPQRLLKEVRGMLRDSFGIDHVTIQLEPEGFEEVKTAY